RPGMHALLARQVGQQGPGSRLVRRVLPDRIRDREAQVPAGLALGKRADLVAEARERVRHVADHPVALEDDRRLLLAERFATPTDAELVVRAREPGAVEVDVVVDGTLRRRALNRRRGLLGVQEAALVL